jgi:hypothetical protein
MLAMMHAIRNLILAVATIVTALAVGNGTGFAAKLTPDEIKATFFNGQTFTASTQSGTTFKMTFTADGKVTRAPNGRSGSKGQGTWTLNAEGFCTTWQKATKSNCYTLASNGDNKWSVMRGNTVLATWSK